MGDLGVEALAASGVDGVDVEMGVFLTFMVLSGVTGWMGWGISGSASASFFLSGGATPGGRIGFLLEFVGALVLGDEGGDEFSDAPGEIPDEELLIVRFGSDP